MTTQGYKSRTHRWVVLIAAGLMAGLVEAQPLMQSQVVRNTNAVLNEMGQPLLGNDPLAAWFGMEHVRGTLVQVLRSDNGVIHPPLPDGTPDPRNALLWQVRVGEGLSPYLPESSSFSTAVTPRPPFNATIFVRMFNKPTVAEASFYGDSPLFTISPLKHEVFDVHVSAVDRAIDGSDADGDGILNSWEKSLGLNPLVTDSDGDGLSDLQEMISGTNPNDDGSFLEVETIFHPSSSSVSLSWQSVANRQYLIESCDPLDLGAGFSEEREVPGLGGPMTETLTGVDVALPRWYRIQARSLVPLPFE